MKLTVLHSWREARGVDLTNQTAIVIDAVRASTTITYALANGALRVFPVKTVREALAQRQAHPEILVGGERKGQPVKGFDLGNSPQEYLPAAVNGREIVLTTTNGTKAVHACLTARTIFVGAFVNLEAVAEAASKLRRDVTVVAAGAGGRPVLDDSVCAGMYIDRLQRMRPRAELNMGALEAAQLCARHANDLLGMLWASRSGQALIHIGLAEDLRRVAAVNTLETVPVVRKGVGPDTALSIDRLR